MCSTVIWTVLETAIMAPPMARSNTPEPSSTRPLRRPRDRSALPSSFFGGKPPARPVCRFVALNGPVHANLNGAGFAPLAHAGIVACHKRIFVRSRNRLPGNGAEQIPVKNPSAMRAGPISGLGALPTTWADIAGSDAFTCSVGHEGAASLPRMIPHGRQLGLAGAEDGGQFVRRDHLELLVSAVAWIFIGAPAAELGHVPEAVALHVFVGDFQNQFGAQRFPG